MTNNYLNKINLEFHDNELEKRFRKYLITENLKFVQYFIILIFVFNVMYAVRDSFFSTSRSEISVLFQWYIVIPTYVVLLLVSLREFTPIPVKYLGTTFLCIFTIATQMAMLFLNGGDGLSIKSIMIIVLFGSYIFSGILYKSILYITPFFILAILTHVFVLFDYEYGERANIILIYIMAITGVISVSYRIEYQQRMDYFKTDLIKQEGSKLRESYVKINALSEIRKDLISVLAHDVRSPIGNLQAVLGLVKDGHLSENEVRKIFVDIEKQVGTVSFLINDILVWIKSQNEDVDIELTNHNIVETISDLWYIFSDHFKEKEIELKLDIQETHVVCQPDIIKSILRNLLSNALKFSDKGSKISITTASKNEKVTISVIDEGVGMSTTQLAQLNKSFTSTTGTEEEKGIGIGLKMCHAMIKSHHSKLNIQSELKIGTSMSFELDSADPGLG